MKIRHSIVFILAFTLAVFSTCIAAKDNPIVAESLSPPLVLSVLSLEIGAENNINIGSISGGGGAGKATFKELTLTKYPDANTTELFSLLAEGRHMDDLRISHGNVIWDLKLVMVQDYSSSATAGRGGTQVETWVLQFGAMRLSINNEEYCWDRTLNASC